MPRRERRSQEVAVDFVDVNNQYSAFIFVIGEISVRGSQWGGGFYGCRLKFWLFYGYGLIFSVTVNKKVKN